MPSLASCQHIKTESTICSVHWTRKTEIRRGGGGERNPREEIKKKADRAIQTRSWLLS